MKTVFHFIFLLSLLYSCADEQEQIIKQKADLLLRENLNDEVLKAVVFSKTGRYCYNPQLVAGSTYSYDYGTWVGYVFRNAQGYLYEINRPTDIAFDVYGNLIEEPDWSVFEDASQRYSDVVIGSEKAEQISEEAVGSDSRLDNQPVLNFISHKELMVWEISRLTGFTDETRYNLEIDAISGEVVNIDTFAQANPFINAVSDRIFE